MNDVEKAIEFYKAKSYEEGGIRDRYTRLAISALEKQLNGGWIPCSEKLPTSDGRFEVTIKGSKGKRHVETCNFDKNTNKWGFDKYWSPNVIAWRSRPEPYKEETK